ncbi:MAG: M15 family metallopeptidase [Lachnospiraceae bacterium]|nr:M15 family metallopeptidase [Lachnospiraceae bacterium]
MTPVRIDPDVPVRDNTEIPSTSDGISSESIDDNNNDPENISDGSGEPEGSDEPEDPDTPEGSDNSAGIFTSSEITDELKTRINGKSYAEGCTIPYEDLRYLQLSYIDFNGESRVGEMICNKAIANDLIEIFSELYHNGYQIDKIRLIDDYNADDDASCDDDNTSCFNYRVVAGSTNLSKHAQGVAVDINPFYNPYVTYPDGKIRISPVGSEAYADRSSDFPHKIDENDLAYKLFTKHGFAWGGHWKTLKDYQHFQKPLK